MRYQVFRNDEPYSPIYDNKLDAYTQLMRVQPTSGAVWVSKNTHYEVREVS